MKWFALPLACACLTPVHATTINAASCSHANVTSAIASAAAGDTVQVPAGTCSWSGGISISGISLIGAGSSTSGTVITAGSVDMDKHASRYTRLSGFRFSGTDQHFEVDGSPSAKPFVIDHNYFRADASPRLGIVYVNGGVIHNNEFTAVNATTSDVFPTNTDEDWSQAPTFGTQDASGERNIYFEDNIFTNILETMPDGDSGSRLVIRHNTYVDSSIVFHGGYPTDSSARGGIRQFEVYNNVFDRVSNAANLNKWIWVRGGTGIIANNTMEMADSPDGSTYPNKAEIRISIGCPTPYPVQYQVGQSNQSPQNPPTQPLAMFGNTGAGANSFRIEGSDTAGPPCSTPDVYIQAGRDYVLSNTWNWTPYAYPHPLQSLTGASVAPAPPSALTVIQ